MSDEVIKPPAIDDNNLSPALKYDGNKPRVKFEKKSSLKEDTITYTHGAIVNKYIV